MSSIFSSLKVYKDPKIILVAMLGFSSGLPLVLILSTLTIWLAEEGISKTTIGIFALIGTPYTLKFLWSPFVDQINIPFFTSKFGKRRGWLAFTQIFLILSIIALGSSNPSASPLTTAVFALMIAFFSATQDIVIDAYRVEILTKEQQGAGAAAFVFGYRIGMLASGAGALFISTYAGWFAAYAAMAALLPIGLIATFIAGEPQRKLEKSPETITLWFERAVIEPFSEFIKRDSWILVLVFIVLYKLGDAFAGVMTGPFLIETGFSKNEIAIAVKTFGLFATLLGAFAGGAVVYRLGIIKSLLICGILQMLSNLMFVWQASVGYDIQLLMAVISVENFSGGMGTAAFVAFISRLCNKNYTATQYALFSSLASVGRTWLSSSSGFVVDKIGWIDFFILSTIIAIPGLLLLKWIKQYGSTDKYR